MSTTQNNWAKAETELVSSIKDINQISACSALISNAGTQSLITHIHTQTLAD